MCEVKSKMSIAAVRSPLSTRPNLHMTSQPSTLCSRGEGIKTLLLDICLSVDFFLQQRKFKVRLSEGGQTMVASIVIRA